MGLIHNSGLDRRWAAPLLVLPGAALMAYLVAISIFATLQSGEGGDGTLYWVGLGLAACLSILLMIVVVSSMTVRIGTGGVSRWTLAGRATLKWGEVKRVGRQGPGIVLESEEKRLGFVPSLAFARPAEVEKYIKRYLPSTAECEL
ncbi:MAG: hypothetical protein ABI647_26725 [Gemmatimonadota bacterium]